MSDSIFQINTSDAMLQSLIKRTSGAIPYLRATVQVASTSSVKAPAQSGINTVSSGNQASGQVNPNTGLQNVGNAFPFYTQGKFGFVATPTTITLYWDGTNGSLPFVVKRVDGTSFSVPQGSLVISGLNAGTIYGFLPYNCLTNQTVLSFVTGDAGSPRFAFSPSATPELKAQASQRQNLSSNEAITENFVYYTTSPSGTISGQGSPGVLSPYSEVRDAPDAIPV